MSILSFLRSLAATLFRRSSMEEQMEEELRLHIQNRADDLEKSGLARAEAERQARIEFGGYEHYKEECRESIGAQFFETVLQDLRFGWRTLRKSPGFACVAVLTLALGIGANTAIFSLIDAVMLRLLPVQKPEQLVMLVMQEPGRDRQNSTFTNPLWEAVRDQQNIFSGVFAWSPPQELNLKQGGAAHYIQGIFVSGDYFSTLGLTPAAGRLISASDDHRGCMPIAVLSYGFWQSWGGSNEIGKAILLDGQSFQIVGVSPPNFHGLDVGKDFDLAIPLCTSALFDKRNIEGRSRWWLRVVGRTNAGPGSAQIKARLEALSPSIMQAADPHWEAADEQRFLGTKILSVPAATGDSQLRSVFGKPLKILMAAVGLVLLIACANLAGLMLARASVRAKEIAIRNALGASRARLVRQLLTESLLLSLLGTALGLFLARWGNWLLVRNLSTSRDPVFVGFFLDGRVLAFTIAVTVLTAVLIGLLPALRSTRTDLNAAMKVSSTNGTGQRSRFATGKCLVAGQIALSLVLLAGGGLLLRTFVNLITLDLGFDRNNVLVLDAKPQWFAADTVTATPAERAANDDEILRRLGTFPGVISASRSFVSPIGNDNWMYPISSGIPNTPTGENSTVHLNFVSPGYFATLRIRQLGGRDFNQSDTRTSAPVAIIDETAARTFYPGVNPIGRYFRANREQKPNLPIQVVGIVKNSKYRRVREPAHPTVFLPAAQGPVGGEAEEFELRTSVPPSTLIPVVQKVMADVNLQISIEFHTLAEQVDDNLAQDRLLATLSTFFAGLALVMVIIGLHGAISYLVVQRRAEFGIRMALGASRSSVLRLVMRDVAVILACGVPAGVAGSLLGLRVLRNLVFGLSTHDPATIGITISILAAVALIAGYLPARRAMQVDPMVALRYE